MNGLALLGRPVQSLLIVPRALARRLPGSVESNDEELQGHWRRVSHWVRTRMAVPG
jgi:hypothetical protein